jgi:nickel/cobalt transporter (NicO) family protein
MSLNVEALLSVPRARSAFWPRLVLAGAAIVAVAGLAALLAWAFGTATPPPTRAPFGLGTREAAPAGGLAAWILSLQASFYRTLQEAISALKSDGAALPLLLGIGFAYGVFHAAGPGHGKAVIAAYVVASERALLRGVALSFAAALLQAVVACLIVIVAALILHATAATMQGMARMVEIAGFAAVALLGATLTWRKSGKLMSLLSGRSIPVPHDAACDHIHVPGPEVVERLRGWRETAAVVAAAGIRPCTGAIVVLVFTLSQGLLPAGIAATFTMAIGTALTTGSIAAIAVFGKRLALRMAGGRGATGEVILAAVELLAAAFVLVLGIGLLAGFWTFSART